MTVSELKKMLENFESQGYDNSELVTLDEDYNYITTNFNLWINEYGNIVVENS